MHDITKHPIFSYSILLKVHNQRHVPSQQQRKRLFYADCHFHFDPPPQRPNCAAPVPRQFTRFFLDIQAAGTFHLNDNVSKSIVKNGCLWHTMLTLQRHVPSQQQRKQLFYANCLFHFDLQSAAVKAPLSCT